LAPFDIFFWPHPSVELEGVYDRIYSFPLESTLKQIDADIALNPGNPALWQTRATLLKSHGKTDEALLPSKKRWR